MSLFHKATREKAKLRLGLVGPAGSGKTYTALRIAHAIAKRIGKGIAVIDSEQESASLYVGEEDADGQVFEFDTVSLSNMRGQYSVENYIRCLRGAAEGGYGVVIVDSLSHAWAGPGGVLEFLDKVVAKSRSGNSFAGWREATPLHNRLIEELLASPFHLIVTMRSKVEWVIEENERGKKVPRKVGMQPVQREGLDYEFDIVGDLEQDTHKMMISKSRCSEVADGVFPKPGAEFALTVLEWLEKGTEPVKPETWEDVREEWEEAFDPLTVEGHVVPFLESKDLKHPTEMDPMYRRRTLEKLRNGGREALDAFLEATKTEMRTTFMGAYHGLFPSPTKKHDGDGWKELQEAHTARRHAVQRALYGVDSLNDVTPAQALGARGIRWIRESDEFEEVVREVSGGE